MEEIIVDERCENQRLDKFLKRYFPKAPAGFLYKMLRKKNICLNGHKAEGNIILKNKDVVNVYLSGETISKFKGIDTQDICNTQNILNDYNFASGIVYEDDYVLIYNKPAGMLTQKASYDDYSLCDYLIDYLFESKGISRESVRLFRPAVVNRLDRNTSGLLVCAKTLSSAQQLSVLFRERTFTKQYLALVYGKVASSRNIEGYLKKNTQNNTVHISETYKPGFKRITTCYEPVGFLEGATLLLVDLVSGMPHQIRAQLSAEGHPVVGDRKYCSLMNGERKSIYSKRQFLHSYRLIFPTCRGRLEHLSGQVFYAELPEDLKSVISGKIKFTNNFKLY